MFTINAVSALGITLILFGFLYYLAKRKVNFGIRTLIAMIFGILIGLIFQGQVDLVRIFGQIYTRLISAIVVPLIFISVIASIIKLENTAKLKSIGLGSIFWLSLNTLIAAILGVVVSKLFKLGVGVTILENTEASTATVPTLLETILNLFPRNIFAHAANQEIIPLLIFALMIGFTFVKLRERIPSLSTFKDGIDALNTLLFGLVRSIIKLTPYAVLSLIAYATSRHSANIDLWVLILPVLVAYLMLFIQTFLVHGTLLALVAKVNPIRFFKGIFPAQIVAFTSQSSIGTLPVTIRQLKENLGVHEDVASFVATLGANMGMPGCAGIWPTMLAVFAINALDIPFGLAQYAMLIGTTVLVSIGTVGVPGTATITATAVFASLGLPLDVIVLMTPISSLVDMGRTATNVTGAATATLIVAKKTGHFNEDIYNQNTEAVA